MKNIITRKTVSMLLIMSIFILSVPAAFAAENKPTDNKKAVCTDIISNVLAFNTVIGFDSGDNEDNAGISISPHGNERYKYRTEIRYGSWEKSRTMTVTKENAKTADKYKNYITSFITSFLPNGISGVVQVFMNEFYTTPFEAAGTYTIQRRSATKMQINILTGAGAIIDKGYQFKITHNGKTITKTFWY